MAGRNTPQDPNYKLYALYGGKDKYEAAKKARDDAKSAATKSKAPYEKSNEGLKAYLETPYYGLYAKWNAAKEAHNATLAASIKAEIDKTKAKMTQNYNYIYLYDTKIKEAQDKFEKAKVVQNDPPSGSGGESAKSTTPGQGPFYFNAPLINNSSAIEKSSLPKMLPSGEYPKGDALTFWTQKENIGGKGTIQMDRQTNTVELKANAKKQAGKDFDDKMYGFKFQYNPTTVNMSWSGMMGANPVYEAAGLDPAVPMATNLFTGTVSFDIILNRIHDLALINPDGSFVNGSNPYSPAQVSDEDVKMIVQKGTMYDLEYLFRTLHGYAFYTNFKSTLMGKTNDPGWLPVRPVELHLGNKLRYRVRVSGLEVVHKIFTSKMVPILSVVSITCMRYWDGPPQKDPKK